VLLNLRPGEEGEHAQILGASVVEVVRGPLGEHEHIAWFDRPRALGGQKLPAAGEDVLRFLRSVDVLAKAQAGRDGEIDRARLLGLAPAA
jgi:hypothetical protein